MKQRDGVPMINKNGLMHAEQPSNEYDRTNLEIDVWDAADSFYLGRMVRVGATLAPYPKRAVYALRYPSEDPKGWTPQGRPQFVFDSGGLVPAVTWYDNGGRAEPEEVPPWST